MSGKNQTSLQLIKCISQSCF